MRSLKLAQSKEESGFGLFKQTNLSMSLHIQVRIQGVENSIDFSKCNKLSIQIEQPVPQDNLL